MNGLSIVALLSLTAFSTEIAVAPRNVAADTPGSGWTCEKPPEKPCKKNWKCAEDWDASTPANYASELRCLIDWMSQHAEKGPKGEAADPSMFEKERARTRYVLRRLSEFNESVQSKGHKPVSEENRKQSMQHYLSGVLFFQKGDYEKARTEWSTASELDPSNDDAKFGLERIDKLYKGSAVE